MKKISCLIIFSLLLFGCKNHEVVSYKQIDNAVIIQTETGIMGIYAVADGAFRIKAMKDLSEDTAPEWVFLADKKNPSVEVSTTSAEIVVKGNKMHVHVNRKTGALSFTDIHGKVFLSETAGMRRMLPDSIQGEPCYFVEQVFDSPEDEMIFGLGQFQDGHYDLRGRTRRLTQVNSQIAIPFIYSNKGYGLLWHQYGLTEFNPTDHFIDLKKEARAEGNNFVAEVTSTAGTQRVAQNQSLYTGRFSVAKKGRYSLFLDLGEMGNRHYVVLDGTPVLDQSNMWLPPTAGTLVDLEAGDHEIQLICKSDNQPTLSWKRIEPTTTFRSPHAQILDYTVFAGTADEVIASYRNLTGNAPMFPKWAYGFWQCRERYTSASHLIETVKEFRKRKLPMDVIVQDWQYWGNRGWGVPQFDERNYPNPSGFIKELHDLNAHFNISIWSNPDKNSEIGKAYVSKNRFVPNTKWLDYFNPETQREYWQTLHENMFVHGVDSWWMDAVEPENDALRGQMTHAGPGEFVRLVYPLKVSQAVYEGQRASSEAKRVCILTRSAFSGQQRYGVINWSGDIGWEWDTYRRQIVAGLNFCLTGLPYWTTDIGGFFRPGRSQYTDASFHELLTRWYQWGAFNPIFRMHGYQTETEPWKYGDQVEKNMRKMLNLRYQLLPYIYSEAWQITKNGSTLMRPMVMDFNSDPEAVKQAYQYMFGKSFLVAPIIEANARTREVYLPNSCKWYNYWTGTSMTGGQTVRVEAPLDQIPLFVRAGSIVPFGEIQQYADEKPSDPLEIRIYPGADAQFVLYEDEGDSYNYEDGVYTNIAFVWNESKQTLTIKERTGSFPDMRLSRTLLIKRMDTGGNPIPLQYNGKETTLQL